MQSSKAEKADNDALESSSDTSKTRNTARDRDTRQAAKYPGVEAVIHGNGAVAHVMGHVCGGVIGYPITPSTEISELFEAYRARGGCKFRPGLCRGVEPSEPGQGRGLPRGDIRDRPPGQIRASAPRSTPRADR